MKVQASFLGSHVDFNKSAVSEVRVLLGQNGDKFDTNGNVDRPIYLDGSLYTEGKADSITASTLNTKSLKLFSDTKVAA